MAVCMVWDLKKIGALACKVISYLYFILLLTMSGESYNVCTCNNTFFRPLFVYPLYRTDCLEIGTL